MHYDGHEIPTAVMKEFVELLGQEMEEHKPFAGLRKLLQGGARRLEAANDDGLQPCPEVELGLS